MFRVLDTECSGLLSPLMTPAQGYCWRIFLALLTVSCSASRAGIYIALEQHLKKEIQFILSCHNGMPEHQALVVNVAVYASAKLFKNYI